MNSSSTQSHGSTQRKHRIHKRTLAVVFCLAIIPWILVSVPGEVIGGGGTSGLDITQRQHGWPFVHLHSARVEIYGNWMQNLPKPVVDEFIAGSLQGTFLDSDCNKSLQLNLYIHRASYWFDDHSGFWLEPSNWPAWNPNWKLSFRPLGLLCNFLFVGFVVTIVGIPVEIRIRRQGRLFKFSLKTTLAIVVIAAMLLAFGVSEHSKSSREEQNLQALEKLEAEEICFVDYVEYQSRFPLLFSHLLNNGKFPWGDSMMFRKISKCSISLYDVNLKSSEQISGLAPLLANSNVFVLMDVYIENDSSTRMLDVLSESRIVELNIHFDCCDWVYQKIGPANEHLDWDQAVKLADLKFETKNRFRHLESLSLIFDSGLNQKEVLKHFRDSPALNRVRIYQLSEVGASYILQTRSRWPKTSVFECADEVSKELKLKLKKAFPNEDADDLD